VAARLIATTLLLICWARVEAQEDVVFEQIYLEHGLSQSSVLAIFQDSKGFLWLGTQSGLNLYDGKDFSLFSADGGPGRSLSNDEVQAICEDRDGMIWVGTKQGLNGLDPDSGRIEQHPGQHLPSNAVVSLCCARDGAVWVGTRQGVARFDPHARQLTALGEDREPALAVAVSAIVETADGEIWASASDSSLRRFDPATFASSTFVLPAPYRDGSAGSDRMYWCSLEEQSDSHLLAGFGSFGLYVFDRRSGAFAPFSAEVNEYLQSNQLMVMSFARGPAGELWIATYQGGLLRVAADGGGIRVYSSLGGDHGYLASSHFFSVVHDASGLIWAGSLDSGLFKARREKFGWFGHHPQQRFSLSSRVVLSVLEDRDGIVWVGLMDGLDRIDPVRRSRTTYREVTGRGESERLRNVFFIADDGPGHLLVGGYPFGLLRMSREDGTYVRLGETRMLSGACRAPDGKIWVAALNEGAVEVDPARGTERRFDAANVSGLELGDQFVSEVLATTDGSVWIGTGAGLFRLDPEVREATGFRAEPGNPKALQNAEILDLMEASDGSLWIGTSRGLSRFDGIGFTTYGVHEGLPNNVVYAVLEDLEGRLWIGTNNGLCRLDPATARCRTYGPHDGLVSREFNQGQSFRAVDGRLFFGTMEGVVVFDPATVEDSDFDPPITITSFTYGQTSRPRPHGWPLSDQPRLGYAERDISVGFAGLDLSHPQLVEYWYRLDGYDSQWKAAGTARSVAYTNLPPGRYELRVMCSNADGVRGTREARLRFTIEPALWQKWWLRVLALGLAAALVYGLYSARMRRIERQRDLLQREVEARTEELRRLARTDPLTGIHNRRYFLDVAEKELQRARRYQRSLALLMIDIDHFKEVNDTFGHAAGDVALKAMVAACEQELRESDRMGRLGGEEFAIMLPEVDHARAESVAERLRTTVDQLDVTYPGAQIHLTVSIGIACLGVEDLNLEGLLRRADAALYQAKAEGRNRVVLAP
jgi:diguanylate cyclase (GGDEF)-like protein